MTVKEIANTYRVIVVLTTDAFGQANYKVPERNLSAFSLTRLTQLLTQGGTVQ